MACTRASGKLDCQLGFSGGGEGIKGNSVQYNIDLDSPPTLMFSDARRSDFFIVDLNEHAAAAITRIVDTRFAGSKVCHGMYLTESELKALKEHRKE
jgi:hypothetical protein